MVSFIYLFFIQYCCFRALWLVFAFYALLLSCQPRVIVKSSLVNTVIRDLESTDRLCINPINRIGLIHK